MTKKNCRVGFVNKRCRKLATDLSPFNLKHVKAVIVPNSNLTSMNMICCKNFHIEWKFIIFPSITTTFFNDTIRRSCTILFHPLTLLELKENQFGNSQCVAKSTCSLSLEINTDSSRGMFP